MRIHPLVACTFVLMSFLPLRTTSGDIVAYFPFDATSPFRDSSGNGRNLVATETTNVTFEPGVVGEAAFFPGTSIDGGAITADDFFTLPMDSAPDFGLGDVSVSLWYRRNNPQDDLGTTGANGGPDGIYDSLNGTASGYQLNVLADGRVNGRFDTADEGFVVVNSDGVSNLEANDDDPELFEWHHIAYTVDREAEDAILYIDGEVAEYVYAAGDAFDLFEGNITPSQDFWIGRANGFGADGAIDDFALFDQVLTADEVASLFSLEISPADFVDSIPGDFDGDGALTAADVDQLTQAFGEPGLPGSVFDLDGNGTVGPEDQRLWVEDIFGTFFGDADLNKSVEFADFLLLSANFSQNGGWSQGDFDGSGTVEFADFLSLSENFGSSVDISAVPEPSANTVAMLALVAVIAIRRR